MERIDVAGDGRAAGVERATEVLGEAGVVVLPTDTCYGIAADAFSINGTERLLEVLQRDRGIPLPVLVRSPKQLAGLTSRVPAAAEHLMAAYWPGPVTLVLHAEPSLKWDLGRSQGTLAVRMPLDDVALAVIRAVGPLAVTAAARAGQPPPQDVDTATGYLGDEVALYLDDGPRSVSALSTIVDLTRRVPHVLRPGSLDAEQVLAVARGELDPADVPPPER